MLKAARVATVRALHTTAESDSSARRIHRVWWPRPEVGRGTTPMPRSMREREREG
jgi:hypothetical protein